MDQTNNGRRPPNDDRPFRQPYAPQDHYVPNAEGGGGWARGPRASVVDEAEEGEYEEDVRQFGRNLAKQNKRKADSAPKAAKKPSSASPFVPGMTYLPDGTLDLAALETINPSLHPSGALPQPPPLDGGAGGGAAPAARLLVPPPPQRTTYAGPQRPLTGERALAREAKVAELKKNPKPTNFTEAQAEDDARVAVAYMDWLLNAPKGENSELDFWLQYDGFARSLRWMDHLGHWQIYKQYRGKDRYARQKRLYEQLYGEDAPLVGQAAVRDSLNIDDRLFNAQRATTPARAAAERAALMYAAFGTDSEAEEAEEEEAPLDPETAGPDAPRFYVYQLDNARPRENIADRKPTREEVEQAIMQGRHVTATPMTWAEIVDAFALSAFTKGSPPPIRRDKLPLALKHGGVVLLRQRADGKGRKGFLYPYLAAWMDRASHRAMHVASQLARLDAQQAEDARAFNRFEGTAYGGPASTRGRMSELEKSDLAHSRYDDIEAKFEADEAKASAARAQQSAAAVRQLKADAEAIQKAALPKTRRVVRATEDDDAGDVSDADGR